MNRRETVAGMLAMPIVAALPAAAAGQWHLALSNLPQPQQLRSFNPFASGYPGRLPLSDRHIVLGSYAGFTVTGYRS